MSKILQLNGSPRDVKSTGFLANNYLISKIKGENEIIKKNIYDYGLENYSKDYMADFYNPNKIRTKKDEEQEVIRSKILEDYLQSDIVVMNLTMYNFSYSATAKMFIDTLFQPGVTFNPRNLSGSKGLMKKKEKIFIITTAGSENELSMGINMSIKEAFNYLNATNELIIIPIEFINSLSEDEIKSKIDKFF